LVACQDVLEYWNNSVGYRTWQPIVGDSQVFKEAWRHESV
jgi:hypothetical protein